MPTQRRQSIVTTAVPRGFTRRADSLQVGVHISPRLSFQGSARLGDFPDFVDWPAARLSWQVSWDGGKTWADALGVQTEADSALWRAIFPPQLPVRSFTGAAPPVATVGGYTYDAVARGVLSSFTASRLQDSSAAATARAVATVRTPQIQRTGSRKFGTALEGMRAFFRAPTDWRRVQDGALDPDFHERLSLLGDHGPLLSRLGLVLELTVARPSAVGSVMVRAVWKPGSPMASTVRPVQVRAAMTIGGRSFLAVPASGSDLDAGLRLKVDDTDQFSVHSLDVDGAAAQLMGVASSGDPASTPPAGRSVGLTLAQYDRAARVRLKIANAQAAAGALVHGKVPLLFADDLTMGHHLQISPKPASGDREWFGIGHRRVTYRSEAGEFSAVDEAAVTVAARQPDPHDDTALLVSDVVARWDGWSIAARRPGRQLLQDDDGGNRLADAPEQADLTWLTMEAVVPDLAADGSPGRLPALRYGRAYALRARAVDITGSSSASWAFAPQTPDVTYYRWDPVAAPVVLAPPTLTRSETTRTVVVRSDPRSGLAPQAPSVRTLAPAKVAVDIGLLHGVFDAPGTTRPDASRWRDIVALDAASIPANGPAPTSRPSAARTAPAVAASTAPTAPATTSTATTSTAPTSPATTSTAPTSTATTSTAPTSPAPTSPTSGPTTPVPTVIPTPDNPPGTPRPLPVTWLPDPMGSAVNLFVSGVGGTDATFLPTGSSPTGFERIGGWRSVALQVSAIGQDTVTVATSEQKSQQVVQVALGPAEMRKAWVRAQPTPSLLAVHGLFAVQPGSDAAKITRVAQGDLAILTPDVELAFVHAVRQPLADPTLTGVDIRRTLGVKDPQVKAVVGYDAPSSGQLSVIASWTEWRDDGPGTPAPTPVLVQRHTVFDAATSYSSGFEERSFAGVTALPDLKRRDLTLVAVATSRFVEEWRQVLPAGFQVRADAQRYLDLPAGVDVESVVLSLAGTTLRRGVDYETALDPSGGRFTIRAVNPALVPDAPGLVVEGVVGTVLADSTPTAKVVPSAIRPAPPKPRYVVPAFAITPGQVRDGVAVAGRGPSRLRIWLERPWWSSGNGEQLAVITEVVNASLDPADASRLNRLVTMSGADPALRAQGTVPRTPQVTSGALVDRLVIDEELGSLVPAKAYFNARVHDVRYDAERDAYWADVEFADLEPGAFVRLAVARFQPQMAVPKAGVQPVRLSRIVTLDPMQVLPEREVTARLGSGTLEVQVAGAAHRGPTSGLEPMVRVSLQTKSDGGPDLGWTTTASAIGDAGGNGYPQVSVPYSGESGAEERLLVEEYERWQSVNTQGKPVAPPTYNPTPGSVADAVRDLIGLRPVWVATLPVPTR